MKDLMTYRSNDYFNDWDYFILYDIGIKKLMVTEVHFHKGNWYANEGLQYKMTTMLCVNASELYGREVEHTSAPIRGRFTKCVRLNMGINWYSGLQIKLHGLPYFWNEPKYIKILKK